VKLPEPFIYFVDRSLGRGIVVETLRAAGQQVHAHDDHFAQNTPDTTWLTEVGRRGWGAADQLWASSSLQPFERSPVTPPHSP
jgi:hypothetical protein